MLDDAVQEVGTVKRSKVVKRVGGKERRKRKRRKMVGFGQREE